MQTARLGPPWYFLLRWTSPSTPCRVTFARGTGSLGMPPSETLSCARTGMSAPLAAQLKSAQGLASQRLGALDRRLIELGLDAAGAEFLVDAVADVPRFDAAVFGRADDEGQVRRRGFAD